MCCLSAVTSVDGVDNCHLAGLVDGEPVVAQWDGRQLSVSPRLHRRAMLSVAVDSMFVEAGAGPGRRRFRLDGPVTEVMITLAWSCDVVDAVEYRRHGARRAVVAVPGGSARTVDLADAPRV
jgi:hypothetical protein